MAEDPQLLDVLFAACDALSTFLLLAGAALVISAAFEAAEKPRKKSFGAQAPRGEPVRGPDADSALPGAQAAQGLSPARRYFSSMR